LDSRYWSLLSREWAAFRGMEDILGKWRDVGRTRKRGSILILRLLVDLMSSTDSFVLLSRHIILPLWRLHRGLARIMVFDRLIIIFLLSKDISGQFLFASRSRGFMVRFGLFVLSGNDHHRIVVR
jgi:hypothetical protein